MQRLQFIVLDNPEEYHSNETITRVDATTVCFQQYNRSVYISANQSRIIPYTRKL